MDSTIKKAAENTLEAVDSLRNKMSEALVSTPDELTVVKQTMENSLASIHEKLQVSIERGEDAAGHAQLQAHLGIMEAREKLEVSRDVIECYLGDASGKSLSLIDEMELKAHLARMEADDLWSERGQELTTLFNDSKETMSDLVGKAAGELQEQFGKWNVLSSKQS